MKELEQRNTDPVKQEQRQVIKTPMFLGSKRFAKGLTLWEFSLETGQYKKAGFDEVAVELSGEVRKKVVQKPNCLYIAALNEKNLIKKLKNIKFYVE